MKNLSTNKPYYYENELEDGTIANKVTIPDSTLHTTSYQYDPETKLYTRYARKTKQTDGGVRKSLF